MLQNTGVVGSIRLEPKKKLSKAEVDKLIAKMRERDHELVTGIFKNLENPGGSVSFPFKKYPQDANDTYYLIDGERYTIPRMVAVHLNQNCHYREYKQHKGFNTGGGDPVRAGRRSGPWKSEDMHEMRKIHRYQFANLDFMDDDADMRPTNLSTVSYIKE